VNGFVPLQGSSIPYSILGTSALVNGVPAPILGVGNVSGVELINFQVAWEAQGATIPPTALTTEPFIITKNPVSTVVVMNNGTASPPMRALFYPVQPAISTTDGIHAVAVRLDGSLVSTQNLARAGDVLTLYGTGFGPVTPQPATGTPSGVSKMNTAATFGIAGQNVVPFYSGLTPTAIGNVVYISGKPRPNLEPEAANSVACHPFLLAARCGPVACHPFLLAARCGRDIDPPVRRNRKQNLRD